MAYGPKHGQLIAKMINGKGYHYVPRDGPGRRRTEMVFEWYLGRRAIVTAKDAAPSR